MIFSSTRRSLLPALLAFPLLLAMTTSATAAGLTDFFAPERWKLVRTVNDLPYAPDDGPLEYPDYECDGSSLSCVDISNENSFTVAGSNAGDIGAVSDEVAINWQLEYEGTTPVTLSFDWDMIAEDQASRDRGYFKINDTEYLNPSTTSGDVGYTSPVISQGDIITFGVLSTDNSGEVGEFIITNFNVNEQQQVPAPLPLFGAGATFAWSSRLRARVKGSRPPKT